MEYEGLLTACEISAEEKIKELMEKTFSKVTDITNAALEQSNAVIACHLENTKEKIFILRNARLFKAREEVKSRILYEKEIYFLQAFENAGKILNEFRNKSNYTDILSGLLNEALSFGQGPYCVHTDPRDESLIKNLVGNDPRVTEIVADIETSGGVILTIKEGSITLSNTFEARLKKAKTALREDLYKKFSE